MRATAIDLGAPTTVFPTTSRPAIRGPVARGSPGSNAVPPVRDGRPVDRGQVLGAGTTRAYWGWGTGIR
jgi:hypothetical protein